MTEKEIDEKIDALIKGQVALMSALNKNTLSLIHLIEVIGHISNHLDTMPYEFKARAN